MVLLILFWGSVGLIAYHILFYGGIIWLINNFVQNSSTQSNKEIESFFPTITVLCPAYNEESNIEKKIKSFLSLNYPSDKIKMIVISDDSTDSTNEIVKHYENHNIELVVQKPRKGKQCAHNLVLPSITSDYILSTDANSIFDPNAVNELVKVITSDPEIGIVSGELILHKHSDKDSGEGLYWKYESFLKRQESSFHSIIGANGSIFLILREFFTVVDQASVDDFERTLHVLSKGYKAKYACEALVHEDVTEIALEEFSRKVRIITQEWFALMRNINLLNPFKHFKVSYMLFSHKLIRWLIFVFAFIALLTSLLINKPFYNWIFGLQIFFYIIGILEIQLQKQDKRIPYANILAYFVSMCAASFVAFVKFIMNRNVGIWNPIRKQEN